MIPTTDRNISNVSPHKKAFYDNLKEFEDLTLAA
jgi:hypothetical protein